MTKSPKRALPPFPAKLAARALALEILVMVSGGRHTLDYCIDRYAKKFERLESVDRALAHTLIFGTLRWQGRLDYLIDRFAAKPLKIDLETRNILRLALFQLLYLDRVPASAVVDTAVELTKQIGRRWNAGFVNGLLRRAASAGTKIDWPDPNKDPARYLAVNCSLPEWLAARWLKRFGLAESLELCQAINTIPGITLRTNTLMTNRSRLIETIRDEAETISPTAHTPEGIMVQGIRRALHRWQAFQWGWFQVQDEAAQIIAHLLGPQPGEVIWDACAGMGTKTAHLAQLMKNAGTILATDQHESKLERLRHEMARLGITIATPLLLDLTAELPPSELPRFDRILVDAPCSGLGVLQKNPDGKWRIRPEDLQHNQQRQIVLLERASLRLRPGGVLVYAVCSFEPEENEKVVEAFLQKHPEFAINPPDLGMEQPINPLLTPEGWLKTYPHRNAMDGFFAAMLIKTR